MKAGDLIRDSVRRRSRIEKADHWHRGGLPAHRKRPSRNGATDCPDEVPPPYKSQP
jgi:hypothetical protein